MRLLDLLTPFGFGQRSLLAAPPRAGKTTLLTQMGRSIQLNHPDAHLKFLLVDERPEEVTDLEDQIHGEIFASCTDQPLENHLRMAQLALYRSQRLAESGEDVVLIIDSLTRLSRALNKLNPNGPIGAGGLNIRALDFAKQLFSSARQFREGGSLTIIASVLVETENRMDDIIFREFKGTGNCDLVLDSNLADRQIYPALDVEQSATRRFELLLKPAELSAHKMLRRSILAMPKRDQIPELIRNLERFETNQAFLEFVDSNLNQS